MPRKGTALLAILAARLVLLVQVTGAAATEFSHGSSFCESAACSDLVERFRSSMNTGSSACHDFYAYACSNRTTGGDSLKRVDAELNEHLSKLLREPKRPEEAGSVHKAKDMFTACMDEHDRKRLGNVELRRIIDIEYGGWPILNRSTGDEDDGSGGQHSETAGQSWELLAGRLRRLGYSTLLRINVNIDQRDGKRHIIELDRARAEYGSHLPRNIIAYLSYVAAESSFIHGAAVLLGAEANGEPIKKDIENIIRFQMKLNQLINDEQVNSRDDEPQKPRNYNTMTIGNLNTLTSGSVDWLTMFNTTFESVRRIEADEEVITLDVDYVRRLGELIKRTDNRVLKNYLIWRVVKDVAEDGDPDMSALNPERTNGQRGSKLDVCLKEVKGFLGFTATHLYVSRNSRDREIAVVRKIVDAVKSAFRNLIRTNHWMDGTTKKEAITKLEKLSPKIGYPEWIMDADKLDDYYEQAEVSTQNHFRNIMKLSNLYSLQELQMINTAPDRSSWVTSPLMANAFYHRTMNEIYIPVAILRPPFLDPDWPMAAVFGGIGAVIGHEITHGFDDESFIVAANGSLVNWWTSFTTPRYERATKCVTEQYGKYCPLAADDKHNQRKLCVDGRNTLRENVADIGGVRSAFMAYHLWRLQNVNDSAVTPALEEFSDNQLFFLNFAQIWCTSTSPIDFLKQSPASINSPNKYRLLGPLENLDDFNAAFDCKPSTAELQKDKCRIW